MPRSYRNNYKKLQYGPDGYDPDEFHGNSYRPYGRPYKQQNYYNEEPLLHDAFINYHHPQGHYPQQNYPQEHYGQEHFSQEYYPQENYPQEYYQEEYYPQEHYGQEHYQQDNYPQGHYPWGHYSQEYYPQEHYPIHNTHRHPGMLSGPRRKLRNQQRKAAKRAAPVENVTSLDQKKKRYDMKTIETTSIQDKFSQTNATQKEKPVSTKQEPILPETKEDSNNQLKAKTQDKNMQNLVINDTLLEEATIKIVETIICKKRGYTQNKKEFLNKVIKSRIRDLLQKAKLDTKNLRIIFLYRDNFPITTDEATLKFAEDLQIEYERMNLDSTNSLKIEEKENIFEFFKANISFVLESVMEREWPQTKTPTTNNFRSPFLECNKDNIEQLLNIQMKHPVEYKELFHLVSEMAPQSPEIKSLFFTRILNDMVQNTFPKLMEGYKDLIMKCMRHDILSLMGQELLKYNPPPTDLSVIILPTPCNNFKTKNLIEFLNPYEVIEMNRIKDTGGHRVKMADFQQYNDLLKQDGVTKGCFEYSIKPAEASNSEIFFDRHYTQHFNRHLNFKNAVTTFNCRKVNTSTTIPIRTQNTSVTKPTASVTQNKATNIGMAKSTASITQNKATNSGMAKSTASITQNKATNSGMAKSTASITQNKATNTCIAKSTSSMTQNKATNTCMTKSTSSITQNKATNTSMIKSTASQNKTTNICMTKPTASVTQNKATNTCMTKSTASITQNKATNTSMIESTASMIQNKTTNSCMPKPTANITLDNINPADNTKTVNLKPNEVLNLKMDISVDDLLFSTNNVITATGNDIKNQILDTNASNSKETKPIENYIAVAENSSNKSTRSYYDYFLQNVTKIPTVISENMPDKKILSKEDSDITKSNNSSKCKLQYELNISEINDVLANIKKEMSDRHCDI